MSNSESGLTKRKIHECVEALQNESESDSGEWNEDSDVYEAGETEESSSGDGEPNINNTIDSLEIEHDADWVDVEEDIAEFPFEQISGNTVDIARDATPFDIFSLFFSEKVLDYVVDRTNSYAQKLLDESNTLRKSRMKKWIALTREELKKFLAVSLLMGQIKMPTVSHCFSRKGIYAVPSFSKIMSKNRFIMILRHLHMENNENEYSLSKITPLIDLLIQNIRENYYPDQKLCLGKSLNEWCCVCEYVKDKRHRSVIKFYALCEPNGFISNFQVFRDKSLVTEDNEEISHCQKIVLELMEPYLDKGHILYLDSFYNCVTLSTFLHSRKTHTIGPLRTKRIDNPRNFTKKKLVKSGESSWLRKGPVYVSKWKFNRKVVMMISTRHHHRIVNGSIGNKSLILKPECLKDYNMNMKGVVFSDQLFPYCNTPEKPIKWYKKVFFHLLDISVLNSYVLFKTISKQPNLSILKFRDSLIEELASVNLGMNKLMTISDPMSTSVAYQTVDEFHVMENIPLTQRNTTNYLRCIVCTHEEKRKNTLYRCRDCLNTPPLCPAPCFATYHGH